MAHRAPPHSGTVSGLGPWAMSTSAAGSEVAGQPVGQLHLDGCGGKVKYAQLLNDGSEIPFVERGEFQTGLRAVGGDTLVLRLPIRRPSVAVPVVELFLD